MYHKMAISDINKRRSHWSYEGLIPQNRGKQVRKCGGVVVIRGKWDGIRGFQKGNKEML